MTFSPISSMRSASNNDLASSPPPIRQMLFPACALRPRMNSTASVPMIVTALTGSALMLREKT